MKKILCPIDFTKISNNALEYPGRLAQKTGGTVTLLHVEPLPLIDPENPVSGFREELKKERETNAKTLNGYCQEFTNEFGVPCNYKIDDLELPKSISKMAEKGFDLIVMGTNGADSFDQRMFGSNTYQTLEKTQCPLLMVPEDCAYENIAEIAFATDYSGNEELTVKQLKTFFKAFCPKLTVLHISHEETEVSKEVYQAFHNYIEDELNCGSEMKFKRVVNKDAVAGIHDFMVNSNASLLVLTAKKRNLIQRMMHQSITREINNLAGYPVLVLHI